MSGDRYGVTTGSVEEISNYLELKLLLPLLSRPELNSFISDYCPEKKSSEILITRLETQVTRPLRGLIKSLPKTYRDTLIKGCEKTEKTEETPANLRELLDLLFPIAGLLQSTQSVWPASNSVTGAGAGAAGDVVGSIKPKSRVSKLSLPELLKEIQENLNPLDLLIQLFLKLSLAERIDLLKTQEDKTYYPLLYTALHTARPDIFLRPESALLLARGHSPKATETSPSTGKPDSPSPA